MIDYAIAALAGMPIGAAIMVWGIRAGENRQRLASLPRRPDANQILVGSDPQVQTWLRDVIGLPMDTHFLGDRMLIEISHHDAVTLHARIFLTADDLRGFPLVERDQEAAK